MKDKRKIKKRKGTAAIVIAAALLIALSSAASAFYISLFSTLGTADLPAEVEIEVELTGEEQHLDEEPVYNSDGTLLKKEGVYTYIVGGSSDFATTDTLLLVYFAPGENKLNVMQIPRDTYVTYTGGRSKKINSAFAYGGGKGLTEAVEHTFGIKVDGYAIIGTKVLRDAVDAIGGVTVDVPQDMYYVDDAQDLYIDLKEGLQLLDGDKAEQFVRFRKGYATQDLGRIQAQQMFLEAYITKLLSFDGMTKIPSIINSIYKNIKTDLTAAELISRATSALSLDTSSMVIYTLPMEVSESGSYVSIHAKETLELLNAEFNPYVEPLTEENVDFYELRNTGEITVTGTALDGSERVLGPQGANGGAQQQGAAPAAVSAVLPGAGEKLPEDGVTAQIRYNSSNTGAQQLADSLESLGAEVTLTSLVINAPNTTVKYKRGAAGFAQVSALLAGATFEEDDSGAYDYIIILGN